MYKTTPSDPSPFPPNLLLTPVFRLIGWGMLYCMYKYMRDLLISIHVCTVQYSTYLRYIRTITGHFSLPPFN